jgi:hypothetical protein
MLENNTVDGFVLGPYNAEVRLASISDEFIVEIDQTERISVGIIFDAPPAYDDLRNCLRRRLFLRMLDNGPMLARKLAHRMHGHVTALEAAQNALCAEDCAYKLGIAAGTVLCILILAGILDFIVRKYIKKNKKEEEVIKTEESRTEKDVLAAV